jgi:flavin reductase (DIM6/NTAB) family NADH-FMN oxidoreductase RutF
MHKPVELSKAYRLLNHGPTVLVTTAHCEQRNIMAAAWNMPLDFDPPRIAIVIDIDKKTYTRELIAASGSFAINVPCQAQAEMVVKVGSSSGRELLGKAEADKFSAFNLPTFAASKISAPLVEGCVAWLECKLISEPHAQDAYDTFFGEVVAAQADDRVFANGRWSFRGDNAELHTLHHLGAGVFAVPSQTVQGRVIAPLPDPA